MIGWLLLAAAALAAPDPLVAEMQRFEESRSTAIKAGDAEALRSMYSEGFQGIASGGARVDRETLLTVLQRSAGGDFVSGPVRPSPFRSWSKDGSSSTTRIDRAC